MRFPKQFVTGGDLARMRDLTGGDLRVLLALIAMAGDEGAVAITQAEIADLAGMSRKSTRNCIERLVAHRVIRCASVRGRTAEYVVVAGSEMAPTRAIRVPTYPQGNGTSEGANSEREMAPLRVPTPKSDPARVLKAPTGSEHPYDVNARRALTTLIRERHLPLPLEELLPHAYALGGGGDPWDGYLQIKRITEQSLDWANNPAAALRNKLTKASA